MSVHDQLVWNLHINGIDELLLFLGSNSEETQWCMHVLEIIFLILREQVGMYICHTHSHTSMYTISGTYMYIITHTHTHTQSPSALAGTGREKTAEEKKRDEE